MSVIQSTVPLNVEQATLSADGLHEVTTTPIDPTSDIPFGVPPQDRESKVAELVTDVDQHLTTAWQELFFALRKGVTVAEAAEALQLEMPSELVLIGLQANGYEDRPWSEVEGELAEQMFRLAPALLREWVHARCDRHGRTYFSVKPAGKRAAEAPHPHSMDLPRRQEQAWTLYHDEFSAALAQLRETEPESFGELGFIPLSVTWLSDDPRCTPRKEVG